MQSKSEGALMAARSARRNTVHHGAGAQAEDFTVEFLRLKNDSIQPKVVVVYDDPSRLDGPGRLDTVSTSSRYSQTSKLNTLAKRKISQQGRSLVPSWQQEYLRLAKEIVSVIEKWEYVFEVASNAIVAPSPELTQLENYDTVDITTLLYLVGVHLSWIEPEPKDIYKTLLSVFNSLSRVADLCVTIMNVVDKGLQRLKALKPVLQELENYVCKDILNIEKSSLRSSRPSTAAESETVVSESDKSELAQESATPKVQVPSSMSLLMFIIHKKHDVMLQTVDDQSRTAETQSQGLETEQKILLANVLLDRIFEKLNAGFKGVGKLEINQSYKYSLYKLQYYTVSRFLEEGKRMRSSSDFSSETCSRGLQTCLQRLHEKITEHHDRLEQMHGHVRWILLALESINHQRKIWAYPYFDINHLEQVANHGAPKDKSNFLMKRFIPKKLRPRTSRESICAKILPFERMFEAFLLPPASRHVVELTIEVDKSVAMKLFEDIEVETKKYYTSTIFLSTSDIGLDRGPVSGRRKADNQILYLKTRRPVSPASSTNVMVSCDSWIVGKKSSSAEGA